MDLTILGFRDLMVGSGLGPVALRSPRRVPGGHSPRSSLYRPVGATVGWVVLSIGLLVVSGLSGVGSAAAPRGAPVAPTVAPVPGPAVPAASSPLTSTATHSLLLRNDTLVAGTPPQVNCPLPASAASGNGDLYLNCGNYQQVAVVNGTTHALEGAISDASLPGVPTGALTYDPITDSLYVTTQGFAGFTPFSNITAYNLSTGAWGVGWSTGILPADLQYDPFDGSIVEDATPQDGLYGYDATSGSLTTYIALPANLDLGQFAIDPANNWAYVAVPAQNEVIVANLSNGVFGVLATQADASAVGYDPLAGDILVANSANDNVTVITASDHTVVGSVAVGGGPDAIGFDPASAEMYVSNAATGNITLLNATSLAVVGSLPVGLGPGPLFYDGATDSMLVVDRGSANLSVINATTGALGPGTSLGAAPESVAIEAATNGIVVGDADLDTVSTYNASTGALEARVQLNASPFALSTDPSGDRVFVIEQVPNLLTVLNGTTLSVEASYPLPYQPSDVLYLVATGDLAIESVDDSQVAVLDPSDGTTLGNLSVPDPQGLAEDPSLSTIFVGDFTPSILAISETTVAVTGTLPLSNEAASISYDPVDGLLYISFAGAPTEYALPSTLVVEGSLTGVGDVTWARADPTSGVVFAVGANANLSVTVLTFAPSTHGELSNVTLPVFVYGPIAVDPSASDLLLPDPLDGTIAIETEGPSIGSFSVAPDPVPLGGSVTFTLTVPVSSGTASVSYAGLPSGCVSADTLVLGCTPTRAGSYSVSAHVTDSSGLVTAGAAALTVTSPPPPPETFTVTFSASGLATGAAWSVTFNGTAFPATAPSPIVIPGILNGSYPFTATASGYQAAPASGTVTVAGQPVDEPIGFSALSGPSDGYLSGTVSPGSATVTVDSTPISVRNGAFNVTLAAGAHAVSASAPGYETWTGTETVQSGRTTPLTIALTLTPVNPQPNGTRNQSNGSTAPGTNAFSMYAPYLAVGVVALVLIGILGVVSGRRRQGGGPPEPTAPGEEGEAIGPPDPPTSPDEGTGP